MAINNAAAIANQLDITMAEFARIQNGFSSVTFGNVNATGQTTVNAATFNDATTVRTGSTGTINLAGNLASNGDAISLNGNTIVGSGLSASVTTNGGNIAFGGTISGIAGGSAENLSLNAGASSISIAGNVSGLGTLTLANAGGVAANGGVNVGALALNNTAGVVQIDGALVATSLATLAQNYAIAFNGGASVTNATAFQNMGGVSLGNMNGIGRSMTIRSGASALALNGAIGSSGRLGAFDVVNSGSIALGSGLTLTAGAAQLRSSGTITGGTLDVSALGIAANGAQFSGTGNLVNGQSGAAAATAVTLLSPPTVGQGPYMINGVAFATAPLPPAGTDTTPVVVDQVAQLVRTPTVSTFTQPTAPSVTVAPQSGGPSASSLGSFEPAAGPESGGSSAVSDDQNPGEEPASDDDDEDDTAPPAKSGRQSE